MEAISLNRLAYFAAVVETGSFTRAAERLGITKAVVSQQVARLETEVKTALLVRTTRRVEATEAGHMLYARCVCILREAEDAFDELAQANTQPTGVLRVTAPNDYGTCAIAPLAAAFSRRYPACRVELILSDSKRDLVAEQIDLSIRAGWLSDSSMLARRIGTFRQILVAAPSLLRGLVLKTPADLVALPFIGNTALRDPWQWTFTSVEGGAETVRLPTGISSNATPAVQAAALAGGGLAVLPDFAIGDALKTGALQDVLPHWRLPEGGIFAVTPPARFRPRKVSAFLEMLIEASRR